MRNTKLFAHMVVGLVMTFGLNTAWAAMAGYAQFVHGSVVVTGSDGQARKLIKGGAVNEGDTVSTARYASAQIRTQDGGFIAVRPDTQLKFDSFQYTGKAGASEKSYFSLLKGGFRAVTGLIGRVRKNDYRITTPAATIGIRGTDHETFVMTSDLQATIAGMEVGTYNKVNVGQTEMKTAFGALTINPNQVGFVASPSARPTLLPSLPPVFQMPAPSNGDASTKDKDKGSSSDGAGQQASGEQEPDPNASAEGGDAQQANGAQEQGGEQPAQQTAEAESADGGAAPVPAIRETAAVDSDQKVAQVSPAATSPASAQQEGAVPVAAAPPPVTTSVQATSGSLTLDTTAQTVTSGNTTVSVSEGVYAAQAKTVADEASLVALAATDALTAATSTSNTLLAIGTVSTTPATSAISSASTAITSNTPTVNTAVALTPVDATANATAAQTATDAAAAIATAANTAASSAFADSTAVVANTAVQTANAAVVAANTSVQSNATNVANQNTAMATAQTAASAALAAANVGVTAANSAVTTADSQNLTITQAQSGASALLSTAQAAENAAKAAATAAQAAATLAASLQAAGDLIGAADQLTIARQQLAIAQAEKAAALAAQTDLANLLATAQTARTQATTAVSAASSAANAAVTAAGTALTEANNASTAATNAATALAATATQLAALQSSASTMAADAVIAAYNNPAVVSNNFLGHFAMPEPVAGGYNLVQENMSALQPNTQYVLDGSGNLVEMRSTSFQSQPIQGTPTTFIANADIKWSGGTAADTFKLSDNSIYAGRWSNATVSVKDLSNSVVTTYTPANSLWAVLLTPALGYVETLSGTTSYTLAGNTAPFDAAGNVGTLNSATLDADFTNLLVNASLNLTMPAASSMAGTYTVTANNMPIDTVALGGGYGGFGGNVTPVVSCSGCAAGAGGYSANVGGNFAGTGAASAGLGYDIWATVSPGFPAADLIQGLAAFTAATPPTTPPPTAYIANHIAVETSGGMGYSSGSVAAPADLVYVTGGTSTSGALSSWTLRDLGGGSNWVQTASISGGTATSADAPSFVSTGIQYGEWTGFTGQSMSWSQDLGGMFGGAPTTWMYGPTGYVDAAYAPQTTGGPLTNAMAGTFTYQLDGATAPQSQSTGLTGTLNSATVTADFVNLLVSGSLDITMPGNENWGASVINAPISLGMGALTTNAVVTYGLGGAATTCVDCSGSISANFTGQNLAGVILSYNLYNNTPYGGGDVSGSAALTRNYAGNLNPLVTDAAAVTPTTIEVALGGQGWGGVMSYPIASTTTTGNLLTAFGSSGPGYVDSTIVTCVTCTTNASGQVATSGIYYGTWDAGSYSQSYSSTFTAGSMPPSYWITGPEAGPLFLPQALTGTASYAFDAGQVSNSMGVAGVVNGTTTLSLDFGKQTVGVNLDFTAWEIATPTVSHTWNVATMPGQEAALGNGMGISSAGFTASTYGGGGGTGMLAVTVDGGVTPLDLYSANVNGQLTGSGLTGAIISFNVNAQLNPLTPAATFEMINGVAAFTGPAQSVTTPHRYVSISLADPFASVSMPVVGFYANSTTRALQDVSGNLTAFDTQVVSNNGGGSSSAIANINATLADYGTDAVSGISWGRWAGGSFSVTDRQTGTPTTVDQTINNTSLHWIAESAATSATTLPSTGTYTYTQAGGTLPTDSLGNVGLAPATATLTADFSALTVNLGVSATVAGTTLNATGTNVPIIQKTVFYASSQEPVGSTSHLSVNCTGTCAAPTGAGVVIGKFSGAGATGAAMTYGLQNGTTTISGVAAMHQ